MDKQPQVTKEQLSQAFHEIWLKHVQNETDQVPQQHAARIIVECMGQCSQSCGLEQATEFLKMFDQDRTSQNTRIEVRTALLATANLITVDENEVVNLRETPEAQKNHPKQLQNPLFKSKPKINSRQYNKKFRSHMQHVMAANQLKSMEWIPMPRAMELVQSFGQHMQVEVSTVQIVEVLIRLDNPKRDAITWKEFRITCRHLYRNKPLKYKDAFEERSAYIEYLKALSMQNADKKRIQNS